jgi:mono/diheme cytochrome c family protein
MTARAPGRPTRRRAAAVAFALLLVGSWGCEREKRFDPPDRDARVADAETRFLEVRFDTLSWASPDARAREGNGVYAAECRNCHGTVGEGNTAYADSRGLEIPSLVEADWRYGTSIDSVRHRIYVGHAAGMPTWGVAGITPREIDAVAFYILERLRPEMLGEER